MDMDTASEFRAAGIAVRTSMVYRAAEWTYLRSDDERLTDMLAAEWMTARIGTLPADTTGRDTAARWTARRAVRWARREVEAWNAHAAELDTLRPVHGPARLMGEIVRSLDDGPAGTPGQVYAASFNPMGAPRWSLKLEHIGTAVLRAAGHDATRPDVWSRRHGQHVTRPDRVAFRGVARYQPPRSCRYGTIGLQAAVTFAEPRTLHHHVVTDTPAWQRFSVAEFLTADTLPSGPMVPTLTAERDDTGRMTGRAVSWTRAAIADDGIRAGWRGHVRTTWTVAPRGVTTARAAARAERAATDTIGKRGPARGPWSLAARSLPRAMARDTAAAERAVGLESLLRTAAADGVLTFGTVTVTVVGNAEVIALDGRAWPVREWCQRAALAGVDPTAI